MEGKTPNFNYTVCHSFDRTIENKAATDFKQYYKIYKKLTNWKVAVDCAWLDLPSDQNNDGGDDGCQKYESSEGAERDDST